MQRLPSHDAVPTVDDAKNIISELAARDEILAIILFGSVARNNARQISDIDICVVTDKKIPDAESMDILSYGTEKIDVSLFHALPITIRFRVLHEGKILFVRDRLALNAIMADTVREYLDIEPFIRRNCNRVLGITQ